MNQTTKNKKLGPKPGQFPLGTKRPKQSGQGTLETIKPEKKK